MLSRVEMVSFSVIVPFSIRVCAFPNHTSVPWDRPETVSYTHLDVYKRQRSGSVHLPTFML